jgi:probable HAF family extracellular repeat protein
MQRTPRSSLITVRAAAVGISVVVLLLIGEVAAAAHTPKWTVIDVGTPAQQPGAFMNAVAINDRGQVLGEALVGPLGHQQQGAFVWQNGRMTMLSYPRSTWLDVFAINRNGDVIGDAAIKSSTMSLLWRSGKPTELGTLGGSRGTQATALNNHDQLVGSSRTADGNVHAFLWQSGTITDLGTLGGTTSQATAINNRGQIVGTSTTAGGRTHAFLWQAGTMTDLGSLSGLDSAPRAINDSGVIVGQTQIPTGNPVDAVLWKNGKLVNLGRFGSAGAEAIAINSRGHILIALTNRSGDSRSGVLIEGTKQTKIGALGGSPPAGQGGPLILTGLNNLSQVAGFGYTKQGARRTFVWENGQTTLLPTFDGVEPPWGAPTAINNNGALTGTSYVSRGTNNYQHVVIWRPSR